MYLLTSYEDEIHDKMKAGTYYLYKYCWREAEKIGWYICLSWEFCQFNYWFKCRQDLQGYFLELCVTKQLHFISLKDAKDPRKTRQLLTVEVLFYENLKPDVLLYLSVCRILSFHDWDIFLWRVFTENPVHLGP